MTARGSFVTTRSKTASGPDGRRIPCSYCCTSSISARARRTTGIALLSVGVAQADDPANIAAHCVDTMQHHLLDPANRSNTYLAIGLAVVNPLQERFVEQKHRQLER